MNVWKRWQASGHGEARGTRFCTMHSTKGGSAPFEPKAPLCAASSWTKAPSWTRAHPPIHPYIHPYIHPSIHPSIHPPPHPPPPPPPLPHRHSSNGSAVPLFGPTRPSLPQLAWTSFLDGLVGIREASRIPIPPHVVPPSSCFSFTDACAPRIVARWHGYSGAAVLHPGQPYASTHTSCIYILRGW